MSLLYIRQRTKAKRELIRLSVISTLRSAIAGDARISRIISSPCFSSEEKNQLTTGIWRKKAYPVGETAMQQLDFG